MLTITTLNNETELLTDYKELQLKERVNSEYTLSFILFQTDNNEHAYPLVQEESIVEYNGQEYRIKQVNERSRGNKAIKDVQAQHVYFDLIDEYQYELIGGNKTINELVEFALNGTDFTFEIADSFDVQIVFNYGENNVITLINQILEVFQCEVELQNRHLVFKKQIGRVSDFQFRYKHNLKAINKTIETRNLTTKIRGYWQGGFVNFTSPMADIYGIRHAEPIRDDNISDEATMLQILERSINDKPEISFTIDFVELQEAGYPFDSPMVGDDIILVFEPLNIDISARIMETDKIVDWNGNVIRSQVTLANFKESTTDINALLHETVKEVEKSNVINRSRIEQTNEKISMEVERIEGEISTARSDFNITAAEIRGEVSLIETTLDGKISDNTSLISQTASTINLRIDGVESGLFEEVSDLQEHVDSEFILDRQRMSTIELNLDQISLGVSSNTDSIVYLSDEEIPALKNRISTAEQKITDSAIISTVTGSTTYQNDLGAKVDTTTYSSKVTQLEDSISSKVSSTDYTGNTIASLINQTATTISLSASKINLDGIVRVASTLDVGYNWSDSTTKRIRFRGDLGGVSIESPANTDSLVLNSLGVIDMYANYVYINNNRVLTTADSVTAKFG
ncbi:phage tail spike protein [Anaerobacillus sp. MEB173]|uniref:phage tail spike protein n=1 Tax=Anaerobacillus sp. MEB173 TaxID=3383345 RepID=UPI003F922734